MAVLSPHLLKLSYTLLPPPPLLMGSVSLHSHDYADVVVRSFSWREREKD